MPNATNQAPGPLIVSKINPRYFAVQDETGTEHAVYLTGSHIWNNFHDGLGPGPACSQAPEQNDYGAYLTFLQEHGHNFIRLWRWEHVKSQSVGGGFHLCMTPQPWQRTGPGEATDGKPKFDLSRFDDAYFARLRERVVAAGNAGIYVAVMFFDGWGLHLSPPPDNSAGHPFHADNNINGIALTSILDYQVLPLDPRIQELQQAYLRKVVDTVADLPNVLYEVANESSGGGAVDQSFADALGLSGPVDWGDSTAWQYGVIDFVRRYEQQQGYEGHPIGMTMQFPVPDQSQINEVLWNSPADWVSPGYDDEMPNGRWLMNPPENQGKKVVISDTDHYAPGGGDAVWAWKSFLRGHQPILMDYGIIDVVDPLDPELGVPSYESLEPARYAMGDTLRFASRIRLSAMEPRSDLSSTSYVLAHAGREYLVLQPDEFASPFTVIVEAGTYTVEWFRVTDRTTQTAAPISVEESRAILFAPPFAGGATVLYLKTEGAS